MQALSYKEWLNLAQEKCRISGVELAAPLILLEFATKKSKANLLAFDEKLLEPKEEAFLNLILEKRLNNMPMAYILGSKEFYGRDYFVNSSVLIPRPESELLIDEAVNYFKEHKINKAVEICDIGTGTGCLAISCVLEIPNSRCLAMDISKDALEVAKKNATANKASNKIDFIDFDIVEENPLTITNIGKFDCIISNPPYIPYDEYLELETDVRNFEPKHALTSGLSGFEVIESVLEFANTYLQDDGLLLIEHGYNQGDIIRNIAGQICKGRWEFFSLKDYAGKLRVLKAIKRGK